ncbi:DUF5641 domain-containing protein [Trichonephila inaurata madagascariensis]|uniref:DUF5641 domain-containing protein n=1 Tax=Trichonephila inaurata madagascariensis TaxID=2747483 RepID=A0A8X6XPR5_9ARAC|nr:DUF5641 domain-containing protein [Trichonephila inaurata madagascariensis]
MESSGPRKVKRPEENDRYHLTNLMKFLKTEVEGEERLKLARGGLDSINLKEDYHDILRGEEDKSLVAELGLPIVSKKNVALTLFGGSRTEPKLRKKYWVKLCSASLRAYSNLEFEFLDQNVICGDTPRMSKNSILKKLKRNNIWLSDMGADCPKIYQLVVITKDIRVSGIADLDILDRNKLLVCKRFCQELREQMRSRFCKEYLGQLIQRHGQKNCELKVGGIVLVGCENLRGVNWPIARVLELSTGRDGVFEWFEKWHDSSGEKTVSSGGKRSLLIRVSGGVPTSLEPAPVSGRRVDS